MGNFIFNTSKGSFAYYCGLPAASDALIVIPIEASGVESDATLIDYDDVAALLAAANNEHAGGRKTVTSTTVTVDDSNDRVDVDIADQAWTGLTGSAISDLLIAYDPDTGAGTDSTLRPISWHDFAVTPDGTDVSATINVFARAT